MHGFFDQLALVFDGTKKERASSLAMALLMYLIDRYRWSLHEGFEFKFSDGSVMLCNYPVAKAAKKLFGGRVRWVGIERAVGG